jgi:hypothetical protein
MWKSALSKAAVAGICFATLFASSAYAQGEPMISAGLLCDTHEQVLAIITVEDHLGAMQAVNDAAGRKVCVVGLSAYFEVSASEPIAVPEGYATVKEIMLVAISVDRITMMRVQPLRQFTAFLTEARPKPAGLPI